MTNRRAIANNGPPSTFEIWAVIELFAATTPFVCLRASDSTLLIHPGPSTSYIHTLGQAQPASRCKTCVGSSRESKIDLERKTSRGARPTLLPHSIGGRPVGTLVVQLSTGRSWTVCLRGVCMYCCSLLYSPRRNSTTFACRRLLCC